MQLLSFFHLPFVLVHTICFFHLFVYGITSLSFAMMRYGLHLQALYGSPLRSITGLWQTLQNHATSLPFFLYGVSAKNALTFLINDQVRQVPMLHHVFYRRFFCFGTNSPSIPIAIPAPAILPIAGIKPEKALTPPLIEGIPVLAARG